MWCGRWGPVGGGGGWKGSKRWWRFHGIDRSRSRDVSKRQRFPQEEETFRTLETGHLLPTRCGSPVLVQLHVSVPGRFSPHYFPQDTKKLRFPDSSVLKQTSTLITGEDTREPAELGLGYLLGVSTDKRSRQPQWQGRSPPPPDGRGNNSLSILYLLLLCLLTPQGWKIKDTKQENNQAFSKKTQRNSFQIVKSITRKLEFVWFLQKL